MLKEQMRGVAVRLGQGQHKVVCPICSHNRKKKTDRTLSLKIDNEKALYQCWHCDEQGAVNLGEKIIFKERPVAIAKKLQETDLSSASLMWLQGRGISEDTARKAGLKTVSHWIQSAGKETECIVFPYQNKGQTYASKIRSIELKGFSCNGAPSTMFNIENVEPKEAMIICEGEMDALAFMEAGYSSVVSVPNGAVMKVVDGKIDPNEDNKFKFIWNAKKRIEMSSKVIIATDGDASGQAMAEEIARRIGKDKCWKIDFDDKCKDANDVLMKRGTDGIDDLIVNSRPWPVAGLYQAEHFYDELDEIYEKGMGRGESTGYDNVDELYTVSEGQLTIVTGHPSSGKSEFIDQIMVNMAQSKGWKFAVCSFENEPRLHIAKLISKFKRKPFFEGQTDRLSYDDLNHGKRFVQDHFSFLYQADGSQSTIDNIVDRLKVSVMRHGVRGAVIDPYNYIQRTGDASETDWVSSLLTKIRVFAQAHGVHIWFVAHPTKMMRGADGKVPAPKGYDISGSAAWFAKADVGLTVHRPDPVRTVESEIHVWKCRFSWVGKQGVTELDFDMLTSCYRQRFYDPILDAPIINEDDDDDVPF